MNNEPMRYDENTIMASHLKYNNVFRRVCIACR